jgi:hypothetical protein
MIAPHPEAFFDHSQAERRIEDITVSPYQRHYPRRVALRDRVLGRVEKRLKPRPEASLSAALHGNPL